MYDWLQGACFLLSPLCIQLQTPTFLSRIVYFFCLGTSFFWCLFARELKQKKPRFSFLLFFNKISMCPLSRDCFSIFPTLYISPNSQPLHQHTRQKHMEMFGLTSFFFLNFFSFFFSVVFFKITAF